jgi:hypothetical protein
MIKRQKGERPFPPITRTSWIFACPSPLFNPNHGKGRATSGLIPFVGDGIFDCSRSNSKIDGQDSGPHGRWRAVRGEGMVGAAEVDLPT